MSVCLSIYLQDALGNGVDPSLVNTLANGSFLTGSYSGKLKLVPRKKRISKYQKPSYRPLIVEPSLQRHPQKGAEIYGNSQKQEFEDKMPELELDVPAAHLLSEAVILRQAHLQVLGYNNPEVDGIWAI